MQDKKNIHQNIHIKSSQIILKQLNNFNKTKTIIYLIKPFQTNLNSKIVCKKKKIIN